MSKLTQAEIRNNAISFVHDWKGVSRERAEAQTFWNEFLAIFGVNRRKVNAIFEKTVKKLGNRRGAIDLFWSQTLLVEHKSRGQNLDKASIQAFEYVETLEDNELPKCVLVSDFARFRLFDLETNEETEFALEELPNRIHLFGFIYGAKKREYKDQDPVNVVVAEKLGQLHDALLDSGYDGHKLEVFLVRLVYCLFADDTGIFPKDDFELFIETKTEENGSDTGAMLNLLFQILDTPDAARQKDIEEDLRQFPHVNGALFAETIRIPQFNKRMRQILLEACSFDWGKVSPAIFGSLFQSVMDKEKRRNLGAHYTSEKNILKVIRGLFLDELYREFEAVKNNISRLRQFHNKLTRLRFFDPACGCGNFLVITYREIRHLELEVLKQLQQISDKSQGQLYVSGIDVNSFYGIEYEEFPSEIARVALWLTDHLANSELSAEFGVTYYRLPLRNTPNILHDNALQVDWDEFVSKKGNETETILYILGNPPFIGKKVRNSQQNEDMQLICGDVNNYGILDYVCAWYVKAVKFIENTRIKVAFVSTNSITQGEQVGVLWQYLLEKGAKIHFAHRTFKWTNEAKGNAAVYCVVIGFALFESNRKRLFDYETPVSQSHEIICKNINPYLVDSDNLIITNRKKPLSDVPELVFGNMPNDDGNFLFTEEEITEFLTKEPKAEKFVYPIISAREFLNGENRFCLWLKDANPTEWRNLPAVMERVQAVRKFRSKSNREATRKLADVPSLFGEIRQPNNDYVLIPCHSSENRRYVPISFFSKDIIFNNSCVGLANATTYHFGVLTSLMHNAWMRQVCGRIKSDYRYSNNLVYNNFPFPTEPTEKQIEKVEKTAQSILDARAMFPDATLADLYDPNTMPPELVKAHRANDEAVDACYGSKRFKNELERLEFLFDLYRQYTEPLAVIGEKATRKQKPIRRKITI